MISGNKNERKKFFLRRTGVSVFEKGCIAEKKMLGSLSLRQLADTACSGVFGLQLAAYSLQLFSLDLKPETNKLWQRMKNCRQTC